MRCSIVHVQDSDYPGDPSGAYPNRAKKIFADPFLSRPPLLPERVRVSEAMRTVEAMMHRSTTTAKSELETLPGVAVACVLQCLCCQEVDELAWKLQDLL